MKFDIFIKKMYKNSFIRKFSTSRATQVLIIGGGHAGCEAAFASARMGAKTTLITQKKHTIGEMSCNPSIGGIGKGTLVREIDAMGGLMAKIADKSAIQFKVLNQSKGPAVHGPRAQIDRDLYAVNMQNQLENSDIEICEDSVHTIIVEGGKCKGVVLKDQSEIRSDAVIITTGTFLGAKVHIGRESREAGRFIRFKNKDDKPDQVEPPSNQLAKTIKELGFPVGRLRTGTPPRIDHDTINFEGMEEQVSDDPPQLFSYLNEYQGYKPENQLIKCFITYTNEKVH